MSNPESYLFQSRRIGGRVKELERDDESDLQKNREMLQRDQPAPVRLTRTEILRPNQFNLAERKERDDAAVRSGLANNDSTAQIRYELNKGRPTSNNLYSLDQRPNPLDDPRENSRMMFGGQYRTNKKIDTHEILKSEMFRTDIAGEMNHFEKSRAGPVMYGEAPRYINLDSALKNGSSNPANGLFSFNFMIQGVSDYTNQVIGVSDKLETVTEIQFGSFYIPTPLDNSYVTNATGTNLGLPTLTPNGGAPPAGTLSQIPYGGRVVVEIRELGRQFISDDLNVRHHIEFTSTVQSNGTTLLTPIDNFDTYVFTDPVSSIHGMSLIFRNPFIAISFQQDVFTTPTLSAIVGAGQLLTFVYNGHGLAQNNMIFVRNFATGNAVIDNYINTTKGLIVGTGGLTANQFRLNPDVDVSPLGLGVGDTISAGGFSIIIAARRIRIPLRVRTIVSRLTNYQTP